MYSVTPPPTFRFCVRMTYLQGVSAVKVPCPGNPVSPKQTGQLVTGGLGWKLFTLIGVSNTAKVFPSF